MGYYISDSGSLNYVRSGLSLSPTHGGHEGQHLTEFEQIANKICGQLIEQNNNKVQEYIDKAIQELGERIENRFLPALEKDVKTTVDIIMRDGHSMFKDTKVSQALFEEIYNTIVKELKTAGLKVK